MVQNQQNFRFLMTDARLDRFNFQRQSTNLKMKITPLKVYTNFYFISFVKNVVENVFN